MCILRIFSDIRKKYPSWKNKEAHLYVDDSTLIGITPEDIPIIIEEMKKAGL
jgi:hypothetical protein